MNVQDKRHHLDHYMVPGWLRGDPAKELTGYLRKAHRSPLQNLRRNLAAVLDKIFSDLKTHILKPPLR